MTSTSKQTIPTFSSQQLEGISKALGDRNDGLKGSEIGHLLRDCETPDPTPAITKWQGLFNAQAEDQNRSQIGTHIMQSTVKAINPARYTIEPVLFRTPLYRLNTGVAFAGYQITEKGKVRPTGAAGTFREALERAKRLHSALVQRAVQKDVLRYCRAEIVQENYFHAVFGTMKGTTAKIRGLSALAEDGVELFHDAFGQKYGPPLVANNAFLTTAQRDEQNGFVNLLKGLSRTPRNSLAHDPKIERDLSERGLTSSRSPRWSTRDPRHRWRN
jgi:uncharacterized protein (TIGR02391 family)